MIIALGESIVAIGIGTSELERDTTYALSVVVAFAGVAALWWAYFDFTAVAAERALRRASPGARGPLARDVFTYFHYPVVLGIIFYAVAAKKTLEHPLDPLSEAGRWALGLGVAIFLCGFALMRFRVVRRIAWERLAAAAVALVLAVGLDGTDAVVTLACRDRRARVLRGHRDRPACARSEPRCARGSSSSELPALERVDGAQYCGDHGHDPQEKAQAFRALHEGEPFVIPNPWDAGSARVFEALGFEALATTSSGFAFTLGRLDGAATLAEVCAHTTQVDDATGLPVSVDLENGYSADAAGVAAAIARVAEAGAVGASIEDYDPSGRLYELEEAVERVVAAVEAARRLDFGFVLTARAENHIRGNPDLADTIARLQAFEAAGADVLYAPGLRTVEEIRRSAIRSRDRSTCLHSAICRLPRLRRPERSA